MKVVGLDLGRRNIKLYDGVEYLHFPSIIGEWRERRLRNNYGKGAYEVSYKGENHFAGVLAENESEFPRQMLIEDKSTNDTLLLALIALHKVCEGVDGSFDIVTGLPVNIHDTKHKDSLTALLVGSHQVTVDGVSKTINIKRVRVAVEGGGAFWSKPKDGLIRLIDGGSKTINYLTLKDRRYIDRDSDTLPFGFDTNKSNDMKQLVTRIAGELGKKWNQEDTIYTIGGRADSLSDLLKLYFPNTRPLHTKQILSNGVNIDLNLYANAIGYYNIGRTING